MQGNVDNSHEGKTSQMLMSVPNQRSATAYKVWFNTKRDYMPVFKKAWRKFEGDSPIFADDAVYAEWSDENYEYKGMLNNSNKKHGEGPSACSLF